jgi:hypothetical protein
MGGSSYAYDGEGHRVRQTVGGVVTQYLLDMQPGLAVVLVSNNGRDCQRFRPKWATSDRGTPRCEHGYHELTC